MGSSLAGRRGRLRDFWSSSEQPSAPRGSPGVEGRESSVFLPGAAPESLSQPAPPLGSGSSSEGPSPHPDPPGRRRGNSSIPTHTAWLPAEILAPSGISGVQPPSSSSSSNQGTPWGRRISTRSSPTEDPGCSNPPLCKESLWAGIVTAFNPTRIDTSVKTIPFLPLFWGTSFTYRSGKRNIFRMYSFCFVFLSP